MFTAALFTIAKTWKQPNGPSIDQWIKKMWYICTMEYNSTIKTKILSEISHTVKDTYHKISLLEGM